MTTLTILVMFVVAMNATGPQPDAVSGQFYGRFAAAVRSVAPDLIAQPSHPLPHSAFNYPEWRGRNQRLVVRYRLLDTVEDAERALNGHLAALQVGHHRVPGFADDAYLVAPGIVNDQRYLLFRRSRVFIEVTATGEESARDLDPIWWTV